MAFFDILHDMYVQLWYLKILEKFPQDMNAFRQDSLESMQKIADEIRQNQTVISLNSFSRYFLSLLICNIRQYFESD